MEKDLEVNNVEETSSTINNETEVKEEVNDKEEMLSKKDANALCKTLKEENAKLTDEVADLKDKWLRNVAEFDNYKKRNATLWRDAFIEGKKETIFKILTIGDNIETAIPMISDEGSKKGVELLLKQFNSVLESLEVETIDPTGQEFNPDVAEAVMQAEPMEGDVSGFVKQCFRKGYKVNGKIIRYAQVSVIK